MKGRRLSTPWQCPECPFSTTWKPSITRHEQGHRGEATTRLDEEWQCTECTFTSWSPQGRGTHLAAHRRRRPQTPLAALALDRAASEPNQGLLAALTTAPGRRPEILDHRYVPDTLWGRDREYQVLTLAFHATLQRRASSCALVTGPPGAGKTALVRRFCNDLSAATTGWTRIVYVPCRAARSMGVVLSNAIRQEDPRYKARGYSAYEILHDFQRRAATRQEHIVLVLDDIETACLNDAGELVHLLSRIGDADTPYSVSAILIDADFQESEFPEAGLQTVGRSRIIHVEPLSTPDVVDVLRDRAQRALGPSMAGLTEAHLERIVSLAQGEVRYALEMLRIAASTAAPSIQDKDLHQAAVLCHVSDVDRRQSSLSASERHVLTAVRGLGRGEHTTGGSRRRTSRTWLAAA